MIRIFFCCKSDLIGLSMCCINTKIKTVMLRKFFFFLGALFCLAQAEGKVTVDLSHPINLIVDTDSDIDDMMERFIMEGEKDRPNIPDKSSVYKWLLIIMAVLLGVSLIF